MPIDLSEARNVTSKHEYDSLVKEYAADNPDYSARITTTNSQLIGELCIAYHVEKNAASFLLIKEK